MEFKLAKKIAMVAGASKGLGFGVARVLASEGAHVSIASRNRDLIEAAKEQIEQETGKNVLACVADVRSVKAIENWCEQTEAEYGGVDLLFCNSGGPPAGNFLTFDDKAWQEAIDLLLLSAVRLARAVIPIMIDRGGGSIVFSTSASVKEPIDNLTLSNVIRAAIPALSKTLARELAPHHIRVNNLIPGRIDTDRVRELDSINAHKKNISVEEHKKSIISTIPLGRYGTVDEYARAAVFLLSPLASYITGATLQVDGGIIRSVM